MEITRIENYVSGRYKIYLNDEFAFVLYKGELTKYGIKEGNTIDEQTYDDIINNLLTKRAKLRAMNLLKSRDYTEKTLKNKLKDSCYPENVINRALEYVKSYGYVDDCRYAEDYVRLNSERSSAVIIKNKLMDKGISTDIIEAALRKEYDMANDEAKIKKLILKKCPNPGALSFEERNRIFAFVARKGYSFDIINSVLEQFYLT